MMMMMMFITTAIMTINNASQITPVEGLVFRVILVVATLRGDYIRPQG